MQQRHTSFFFYKNLSLYEQIIIKLCNKKIQINK